MGKSSLYLHIKKAHPEQNKAACARALPYSQASPDSMTPDPEALLERAIQSLSDPSDMILGIPEEPLGLLENDNFSTVNLNDLQ